MGRRGREQTGYPYRVFKYPVYDYVGKASESVTMTTGGYNEERNMDNVVDSGMASDKSKWIHYKCHCEWVDFPYTKRQGFAPRTLEAEVCCNPDCAFKGYFLRYRRK